MLCSLVNTILSTFKENNKELNKKIYQFFQNVSSLYGPGWVNGAVWINILQS